MAIKYCNWVWEGQSTEPKPLYADGAGNGHVFKELDTGESYTMVEGEWQFINLGLSFIKATKSKGIVETDTNGTAIILFETPFIDNEYGVQLTHRDVGSGQQPSLSWYDLSILGFKIKSRRSTGQEMPNITVSWLCTRDYDP